MMRRLSPTLPFGLAAVGVFAALLFAGSFSGRASSAQTETAPEIPGRLQWPSGAGAPVGSETCGACHADIAAEQEAHPMALTGTALTSESATRFFPDERTARPVLWRSPGAGPDQRPRYRASEAGVALADPASGEAVSVDAVFGSGLRGLTPVAFEEDGGMRELRVSWSHGLDAWIETPGSESDSHPFGDLDAPREMRDCVGCHATAVTWTGARPDVHQSEWGVRCERCHGPGEAHAMSTDPSRIFNPGRLGAVGEVAFCGQCHRKPTDFEPLEVLARDRSLVRHAGASLMMSACFRNPGATVAPIACTDCHDPHRAETSVGERSRTVCLRCHEDPATAHQYERVSAASDCVACHLPRQEEVFPGAAFTDHWIRVQGLPPPPGSDRERKEIEYLELLYRNELGGGDDDGGAHDSRERARLLIGLGELLFAQELRTSAVETLMRGLAKDAGYEPLLKAAALLRASGAHDDLDRAEAALEKATALEPDAAQAFFDLGDLRLARGNAEGAKEALETARRLDPDSAVIRSRLGAAYRETGQLDAALTEGRAAVERTGAPPGAPPGPWLELGLTHWRRGELEAAAEALRTALRLDPNAPPVLDASVRLLGLDPNATSNPEVHDLEEARRLAERLAGLGDYREPRSLALLAAIHAAAGDFELAVRTAERALETAPTLNDPDFTTQLRSNLARYRDRRTPPNR